jgi:hypothetical protein
LSVFGDRQSRCGPVYLPVSEIDGLTSGPARRAASDDADGPHNTAFRSVGLEAGSTRFIEVTITNGIPINYRLNEMSDGIGRAAVLAGKRAQEIR